VARRDVEKRFFRPDVARDVDDELAFHLEMRERELVVDVAGNVGTEEPLFDVSASHSGCPQR
jgi:hypothetical protein